MFKEINYEDWDRKEIYDKFQGYLFCVTVEVDITGFLERLKARGLKFYPSICYCIAKTANLDKAYRFCKCAGKIGYFEKVDAHYTVMRNHSDHLFTHMVTKYQEDFEAFYQAFFADKEKAENGTGLYFNASSPLYTVHISILPNTSFKALSYSKPASFTKYSAQTTSYIPFVTVGKYFQESQGVKLPVTAEFHHAVNDGYHAERFFQLLSQTCEQF